MLICLISVSVVELVVGKLPSAPTPVKGVDVQLQKGAPAAALVDAEVQTAAVVSHNLYGAPKETQTEAAGSDNQEVQTDTCYEILAVGREIPIVEVVGGKPVGVARVIGWLME